MDEINIIAGAFVALMMIGVIALVTIFCVAILISKINKLENGGHKISDSDFGSDNDSSEFLF